MAKKEPVVIEEAEEVVIPVSIKPEEHPTPAEAREMFKSNSGLAHVFTTEGMKSRYD